MSTIDPHDNTEFTDLLTALREPACYPHHPEQVELVQTHISAVFLAGEEVYKLKKPVRFSFLDYSTLPQSNDAYANGKNATIRSPTPLWTSRDNKQASSHPLMISRPQPTGSSIQREMWTKRCSQWRKR